MGKTELDKVSFASYGIAGIALLSALPLELMSALLGGLLVYNIVFFGADRLCRMKFLPNNKRAKMFLLVVVSLVVIAVFGIGGLLFASFLSDGPESLVGLIKHVAEVINTSRESIPLWIQKYLPSSIDDWQNEAHGWLLSNALYLSKLGRNAGLFLIHLVFGMVIGGMIALHTTDSESKAPLTKALNERTRFLSLAFHDIVFSQIKISALNTVLTGVFLAVFMPLLGYHLPLIKTMIVMTFVVGLLPIVGNIVSSTVVVLISLGVSLGAAVFSLIFLIVIHQLEYFVNARIIGSRIRAQSWEILTSMLIMEAAFGLPGLVAAPIYYAYIKYELADKKLISLQRF